jgi:hypothetical protein
MSYSQTSPYFSTKVYKNLFLDVMENRSISSQMDDVLFEINTTYNLRPDLLAHDLYNDSKLWWVFSQRNPNILKDPMFDFVLGTKIYLPQYSSLKESLGL